jgi:putative sterol carrier protein
MQPSFQGFARTIQLTFPDLQRTFVLSIAQDGSASLEEKRVLAPDITVTTDSDILAGILDRKTNPEVAFITRKLKVSGKMEDLLRLQKLL